MWGAIIGAILNQIDRNNNGRSNFGGIYNTARQMWSTRTPKPKTPNTP